MASRKGGPRVETSVSGVDTGLSSDTEIDTTIAAQPWITGYWKRLPALALLSLIVTLLSAAACVIVLALSDGANVQDWKVSPAVLIGIFTSVGNAALTYALGEGFRIAWWTRATGKSNTISRLHAYYTHGTSAVSAGLSFKKPSLIALASVLAGIMAIDSPLLQRASSTELVVREDVAIPVSMTLATQLPFGFTGMEFAGDSEAIASRPLLNPSFAQVFRAYSEKEPIRVASALGCQGVCDGEIEAAGLWKSCDPADEKIFENSTQLLQKQLFTVGWSHETGRYRPTNYLSQGYMSVSEGMDDSLPNDEPYILLEMDYSPKPVNSSQARRSIFHKTCRLYSATSRYKIRIHNDTTTTTPQDSESPSSITSSSSSDNSRGNSITLTAPPTFIPGTVQNLRRSVANTNLPLTIPNPHNTTDTTPYILKISQPVAFFDGPGCQGSDLALTSMCPRLHETLGGLVSVAQDILSANVTTPRPAFVSITGTLANQLISPLPVDGD